MLQGHFGQWQFPHRISMLFEAVRAAMLTDVLAWSGW